MAKSKPEPVDPAQIEAHEAMPGGTRTGFTWAAIIAVLFFLIVLITFILQNQGRVYVHFFGWTWGLPVGVALLIGAVCGAAIVAAGGAARIMQLRRQQRKVAKLIQAKQAAANAPVATKDPSSSSSSSTATPEA